MFINSVKLFNFEKENFFSIHRHFFFGIDERKRKGKFKLLFRIVIKQVNLMWNLRSKPLMVPWKLA